MGATVFYLSMLQQYIKAKYIKALKQKILK